MSVLDEKYEPIELKRLGDYFSFCNIVGVNNTELETDLINALNEYMFPRGTLKIGCFKQILHDVIRNTIYKDLPKTLSITVDLESEVAADHGTATIQVYDHTFSVWYHTYDYLAGHEPTLISIIKLDIYKLW